MVDPKFYVCQAPPTVTKKNTLAHIGRVLLLRLADHQPQAAVGHPEAPLVLQLKRRDANESKQIWTKPATRRFILVCFGDRRNSDVRRDKTMVDLGYSL